MTWPFRSIRLVQLLVASLVFMHVSAEAAERSPNVWLWQTGDAPSKSAKRVRDIVEDLDWNLRPIKGRDLLEADLRRLPDLLIFPDGTNALDSRTSATLSTLFQRDVSMMAVGDATFGRTKFDGGGIIFPRDGARRRSIDPVGVSPDKIDFFDHEIVPGENTRIVPDPHSRLADDWKVRPAPKQICRVPEMLENAFLRGSRVQTRFLPVLRQAGAGGEDLGPVAAILHNYGGLYEGASFGYWGLIEDDPLSTENERAVFRRMLLSLVHKFVLAEFLAPDYWWTDDGAARIHARILNLGRTPRNATAKAWVYRDRDKILEILPEQDLAVPPQGEFILNWSIDPSRLPEGPYHLKMDLVVDGAVVASNTTDAKKILQRTLRVGDEGFSTTGEWKPWETGLIAGPQEGDWGAEWRIPIARSSLYDVFALWQNGDPPARDDSFGRDGGEYGGAVLDRGGGGGRGGGRSGRSRGEAKRVEFAQKAEYIIDHAAGESRVEKTQRWVDGVWVYLGTFPFEKDSGAIVRLNGSADGAVCAEAIRIRRTDQAPCPDRGFIHPDANNRYFAFEDGTPYMPVGANYGSFFRDSGEVWDYASEVDRYFQKLEDHGINLFRFWLRRWDRDDVAGLWVNEGRGQRILMDRAQHLHDILYLAEKHGLYLNIVMGDRSPISVEEPDTFERMERFIIEEYGDSRMIFSWDFCNDYELDNPPSSIAALRDLYTRLEPKPHMKNFQLGYYQDALTDPRWTPEVFPLVDFTTLRAYSNDKMGTHPEKLLGVLAERIEKQFAAFPDKPVVAGEYCPLPSMSRWPHTESANEWMIMYGVWGGMAGGATPAWRWSSTFTGDFPDMTAREYMPFLAVSKFTKRVPWSDFDSRPCREELSATNDELVIAACRDDDRMIGFLAWSDPERAYGDLGGTLSIQSAMNGPATLEWIEPWTGDIVKTETIQEFPANVEIPGLYRAAAFYIRPTE